jgi:hypothetical protein
LRCLRSMVYGTGVDNSEELWHWIQHLYTK